MQVIANILISTGVTSLVGLGFALIYQTSGFFNFAHGAVLTIAAYATYLFHVQLNWPIALAVSLGIGVSSLLGALLELTIYRVLKAKGASALNRLIASLGLSIVLQNLISIGFGDETKVLRSDVIETGLQILGARITTLQLWTIGLSLGLVTLMALLLKSTRFGKAVRAVANDPELAEISGINSNQITLWIFALGSALAGVAGILVALDIDMTPTLGMGALLNAVVAVLIGGIGSIAGIPLGALLLSICQQFGGWWLGFQWQDAIAFGLLLIFLLLKPQGFLGRKIRKAAL